MNGRRVAPFVVALAFVGCRNAPPPPFISGGVHPAVQGRSVQIVVDACIKYDTLSQQDDRFLVDQSINIARATEVAIRAHLVTSDVTLSPRPVILVCGALHELSATGIRASTNKDAPIQIRPQPLAMQGANAQSEDLLSSLARTATFLQLGAFSKLSGHQGRSQFMSSPPPIISQPEIVKSTTTLAEHFPDQLLLYIGINGSIESEGKAILKAATKTAGSVMLAAAAARAQSNAQGTVLTNNGRVVSAPGVGFYSIYSPVTGLYVSEMIGGILNTRGASIAWSKVANGEEIQAPNSIGDFLFDVTHRRSADWTPPGSVK